MDKPSLAIGIIAILIASGSLAYVGTALPPIGQEIQGVRKDLSSQLSSLQQEVSSLKSQSQASLRTQEEALRKAQEELAALKAEQQFIEAARQEAAAGPLIIYGAMDAPDMLNIVWPAFSAKYPFVGEVQYFEGAAGGAAMLRFEEEAARGVRTADVRLDSGLRAMNDVRLGLGLPFETKFDPLYDPSQIIADKTLHSIYLSPGSIIYNTDLITPADAPKSWMDLTNPKFKGKIFFGDPRLGSNAQRGWLSILEGLGEEKTRELAKGIFLDNQAKGADTWGTTAYTKVLSGEYAISAALINDVIQQPAGAPVAYVNPAEGVTVTESYVLIHKNSPKPNLAKLFAEWLQSEEGQTILGITGRTPALKTVKTPLALETLLPGVKLMPPNPDTFVNPDKWIQKLNDIFKEVGVPLP